MTNYQNQLAYQESVVRDASLGELVITLHDILSRDLHAGVAAIEAQDVQTLANKTKHGFLVLARLEGSINNDVEGAEKITHFYTMVREQMLKAQGSQDPALLRQLAGFVNDMRAAWAEVQGRERGAQPSTISQISSVVSAVAEISKVGWKA